MFSFRCTVHTHLVLRYLHGSSGIWTLLERIFRLFCTFFPQNSKVWSSLAYEASSSTSKFLERRLAWERANEGSRVARTFCATPRSWCFVFCGWFVVSSGRMTPVYCHSANLSSNSRKEPERVRNRNHEGWFEGGENVPAKLGWKGRDPTLDPGRKVRPRVCFSDICMNEEDSHAPRQWNNSCFPGWVAPWSQPEQTFFPGKNCNMLTTKFRNTVTHRTPCVC